MILALLLATLSQTVAAGPTGEIGPPAPPAPPPPLLATVSTRAPERDPLAPGAVLSAPRVPRIVKLPTPGSELVALRLSVRLSEAATEAGAGRVLQLLAVQRVQARALSAGVSLEGTRTPWGIAYTVSGARADFDLLAELLRALVDEPRTSEPDFERQRSALQSDLLRTHETPAARIVTELLARAAPGPPLEGTPATVNRLTRLSLRELWARTHRPEAMTIVAAGDVPDDVLLSAFAELGAPAGAGNAPTAAAPRADVRGTQVLRHWLGLAFPVADPRDAHAPVAALLVADHIRTANEAFEADVQLWERDGVKVMTVVAGAWPTAAARMRTRVPGLLAAARQGLTADGVHSAVVRVRQDLLQHARTPAGMVTLVGRHLDAYDDPEGARTFLDALAEVTLESTRAFFTRLEAGAPLRVEVRP